MLREGELRDLLRACFDPGLGLDIVELGMVRALDLQIDTDAPGYGISGVPVRLRLALRLAPVTDDESSRAQLKAQVENLLAGLAGLSRVSVEWQDEPAWTAADISAAGQRTLAERARVSNGPQTLFPILNNARKSVRGDR